MSDNAEIRKIEFVDEEGAERDLYVLAQTRIAGIDYLLVSDEEAEEDGDEDITIPVFVIREDPDAEDDENVCYSVVDDEKELDIVTKVFSEILDDVDFDIED